MRDRLHGRYKLVGHDAVPVEDLIEWAMWLESADRQVRLTRVFADNGETHVLNAIAGKSTRRFPLADRMKVAYPRDFDPTASRFCADDFGLDVEKLAYFALSVVWRGTVHQWTKFDGTLTELLPFGHFEPSMRSYLLGETPFPVNACVIVIVCSDKASREIFYMPSAFLEPGLEGTFNCRFVARGVTFRCLFGEFPAAFHNMCCRASRKPIFYGDCERRTTQDFPKVPPTN